MSNKINENGSYDWAAHGYTDDGSEQEWDEETQRDWDEKMSVPVVPRKLSEEEIIQLRREGYNV